MNNQSLYSGLVVAKTRPSDKDLHTCTKQMDFKNKQRIHIKTFNLFLFCFSQSELEPEYVFPNSTIKNPQYFFPLPTQTKKEKKKSCHVFARVAILSCVQF